jgi:hypothetical protein
VLVTWSNCNQIRTSTRGDHKRIYSCVGDLFKFAQPLTYEIHFTEIRPRISKHGDDNDINDYAR